MSKGNCRDELLVVTRSIIKAKGKNRFTPNDAIEYMKSNNTRYKESTINTHIRSRCCSNAAKHHAITYNDFESLGNGEYKVINLLGGINDENKVGKVERVLYACEGKTPKLRV